MELAKMTADRLAAKIEFGACYTQQTVADAIERSQPHVSDVINDKAELYLSEWEKVANHLGEDPVTMITGWDHDICQLIKKYDTLNPKGKAIVKKTLEALIHAIVDIDGHPKPT